MSLSIPAPHKADIAATPLEWLFGGILATGALLLPALWNGFPLIFADTGGYLGRPFERELLMGRSALYGSFLAAGIPWSFWPNIIVQAALAAWTVLLVLRTHGLEGRPGLATAVALGLAVATGLPWNASMLMPDVFVPLAALALHLLAFRRHRLAGWETVGLTFLVAFAAASHMATLLLGTGLTLAYAALCFLPMRLRLGIRRPLLALPAMALALGALLSLTSNFVVAGRFAFTPGGENFVLGRLIQDGIVQRYLEEECPDPDLRLCAYRDELPSNTDDWLWKAGTPLYELGGPEEFADEARSIALATLTRYPLDHLVTALSATARQLLLVRSGEGVNPNDTHHAVDMLRQYAPKVMPEFLAARQQRDAFDFTAMNWLHGPVALLSFLLLPALVLAGARTSIAPRSAALALTALLALLGNAAICGALSNPNHRYQSRIVWLAPLAVAVAGLGLRHRRRAMRPDPIEHQAASV